MRVLMFVPPIPVVLLLSLIGLPPVFIFFMVFLQVPVILLIFVTIPLVIVLVRLVVVAFIVMILIVTILRLERYR